MKTIFISILSGVEAKDILRTDIVKRLLDANLRMVLFLKSKARADFYKKEFDHPNLIYEIVENFSLSRGDKILGFAMEDWESINIDSELDFFAAEYIMQSRLKGEK